MVETDLMWILSNSWIVWFGILLGSMFFVTGLYAFGKSRLGRVWVFIGRTAALVYIIIGSFLLIGVLAISGYLLFWSNIGPLYRLMHFAALVLDILAIIFYIKTFSPRSF